MDVHFSEIEVWVSIKKLKDERACGLNGIQCEALKAAATYIASLLISLLNYMLDTGEYPNIWAEVCQC